MSWKKSPEYIEWKNKLCVVWKQFYSFKIMCMYRMRSYLEKELSSNIVKKGNNWLVKIKFENPSNQLSSSLNIILCLYICVCVYIYICVHNPIYVCINTPFKYICIYCSVLSCFRFLLWEPTFKFRKVKHACASAPLQDSHCSGKHLEVNIQYH